MISTLTGLIDAANRALLRVRDQLTPGQRWTAGLALSLAVVVVLYGAPARVTTVSPASGRRVLPVALMPSRTSPVVPATSPTLDAGGAPSTQPSSSPSFEEPESASESPAVEAPRPFGTVKVFAKVGDPGAPSGVVAAPDGRVYVATANGASRGKPTASVVMAYGPRGSLERTYAIAGQPEGHAEGLTGLALDGGGGLVVLDASTARVLRLDLETGGQATLATLPDLPVCNVIVSTNCEPGVIDHAPLPRGVAFDGFGRLFVSDAGQSTIWRLLSNGSGLKAWYQSIDFATGNGPAGVASDTSGDLVFTVGSTVDVANPGAGGVYKLAITTSGDPGSRRLLAPAARGDEPQGIALGASGKTYVALRGGNAVVVLGPTYVEERRVASTTDEARFDGPAGLAFRGTSVLVTNQSPTANSAASWAVLDVAVEDSAAPLYAR